MNPSLMKFGHLYRNAAKYGIKALLVDHLGLDPAVPMPLVIPHGIDYYQAKVLCDLHCREPLYLATREDIYEQVIPLRGAIRFPHPWLFLIGGNAPPPGDGTLFIAPSPGYDNHEQLHKGIQAQEFAKPWGILLKDRGLIEEDFAWWRARGFRTHCLGDDTNQHYFQDLKEILTGYGQVATSHFTSAAIFAASLSRRVRIITDVCYSVNHYPAFGEDDCDNHTEDEDGKIRAVWSKLTSTDPDVSRTAALHHLGNDFMGTKEELRERYFHAISNMKVPLHLYPTQSIHFYRLVLKLIELGIPVDKLYPFPMRKLLTKLRSAVGIHRFICVTSADFHDFGIVSSRKYYRESRRWSFNPFMTAPSGGARLLPRLPFSSFRSPASRMKTK